MKTVVDSLIQKHDAASQMTDALTSLNRNTPKTVREMRLLILSLEKTIKAMPGALGPLDFKTTHHFSPGIYMRELLIPQGIVLTGKIHKTGHLNILSQGSLSVWTEQGMRTLKASTVIVSLPAIKRVGYAHEDSVWITVHHNPNNERDIQKVEERLFAETFDEAYCASPRSFGDVIQFLGITQEEMQTLSQNRDDQMEVLISGIDVAQSPVHGSGVFATKEFKPGEWIGPARVEGKRTQLGRFCNHSGHPNSQMIMKENCDVDLVALTPIDPGSEILNDYYFSYHNSRPALQAGGGG